MWEVWVHTLARIYKVFQNKSIAHIHNRTAERHIYSPLFMVLSCSTLLIKTEKPFVTSTLRASWTIAVNRSNISKWSLWVISPWKWPIIGGPGPSWFPPQKYQKSVSFKRAEINLERRVYLRVHECPPPLAKQTLTGAWFLLCVRAA